jgi:hypothetical protein
MSRESDHRLTKQPAYKLVASVRRRVRERLDKYGANWHADSLAFSELPLTDAARRLKIDLSHPERFACSGVMFLLPPVRLPQ